MQFPHSLFLEKLMCCVPDKGSVCVWELADGQHPEQGGKCSFLDWLPVTSGVPRDWYWVTVQYCHKWSAWRDEVHPHEFCWWYQIEWGSGPAERRAPLQKVLDRLEECADETLKSSAKTNVRYHIWENMTQECSAVWEATLWKGTWESWWIWPNKNEQCAAVAKGDAGMLDAVSSGRLDCINKGITNKDKRVIIALYSALVRLHLEYLQFWCPLNKKGVARLERVQRRAAKIIKGLSSCSVKNGWERSWFVQPWKNKAWGEILSACSCI